MTKRIPRIGIGGPVGCGKSMLIERVVPILAKKITALVLFLMMLFLKKMLIECVKIWQPIRGYYLRIW